MEFPFRVYYDPVAKSYDVGYREGHNYLAYIHSDGTAISDDPNNPNPPALSVQQVESYAMMQDGTTPPPQQGNFQWADALTASRSAEFLLVDGEIYLADLQGCFLPSPTPESSPPSSRGPRVVTPVEDTLRRRGPNLKPYPMSALNGYVPYAAPI